MTKSKVLYKINRYYNINIAMPTTTGPNTINTSNWMETDRWRLSEATKQYSKDLFDNFIRGRKIVKTNDIMKEKSDYMQRIIGRCIDERVNISWIKDKITAEETRVWHKLQWNEFLDFVTDEIKKVATDNNVKLTRPTDMSVQDLVDQRDSLLDVTAKLWATPRFMANYRWWVLRNINKMEKYDAYPENVLDFARSIPSIFGHRKSRINRWLRYWMKRKNIFWKWIENKNIKKWIVKFLEVAKPRDSESPETKARKQATIMIVKKAYKAFMSKQENLDFDSALAA